MIDYRRSRRRRMRFSLGKPSLNIFVVDKLFKLAFFGLIAGVLLIVGLFLWYSRDLPTPGKLVVSQYADATRIYDRNGDLLYSVYQDQNRTYVPLSKIPKKLQQATIAIEDKDFYQNQGFSVWGYLRAIKDAVFLQGVTGASTISQQLVKNVLLTSERSLPRKIKEFILAVQINQRFSKDEILEMYLNNIGYGGTAVGVEAAAQTYFTKEANELDLAESAFLAGLPQNPSSYSPYTGNKYYIGRSEAVLRRMVEDKYITKEESEKALNKIKKYKFSKREESIKAPHFVLYVKSLLAEQFGEQFVENGGLQVTTTLDYKMQKEAEKIVKEELEELEDYDVGNGAAMVTDPKTGEILVMVGSKDYYDTENDGNFNAAVDGQRQPGSSLKPVIYATAFEKGYTPATLLMDVKTEFATGNEADEPYTPGNYSGKFQGPVQVRFALGNSLNIPAVKMLAQIGVEDAMQKGYDMGIRNWQPTDENMKNVGLSLVLGGRETTLYDEMVAYGVFANKGEKMDLVSILKVTDGDGKTLFENKKKEGKKVLSEEVAYLISHILLDNNARIAEFGPNSFLRIPGRTVAVKTGTTDEKRDNWTIGYTPSLVAGVWVGNNDNSPMNSRIASGVTGASSIWHRLMQLALKGKSEEEFEKPENVEAIEVDSLTGGTPVDGQSRRSEFFIKGTQPTTKSPIYQKEFLVFKEQDPVSSDGRNRWQEGIDAWIQEAHKDDPKYNAPDDVKNPKKEEPTPTPGGDTPTPTHTPTP